MLGQKLAAALDPVGADHAVTILGEGHPALGLAPIGLDHRRDRAHAGERGIEHRRVDPLLARLAAQARRATSAKASDAASEGDGRQSQRTGERGERRCADRTDACGRLAPHQHERNRMNRRDGAQPEEEIDRAGRGQAIQ